MTNYLAGTFILIQKFKTQKCTIQLSWFKVNQTLANFLANFFVFVENIRFGHSQ